MYKVVYNSCYGGFGLSNYAQLWLKTEGFVGSIYDIPRHHPLLVRCVETLGTEANTRNSRLVIRTLENPKYRIEEHDGAERIITPDDQYDWVDASIPV